MTLFYISTERMKVLSMKSSILARNIDQVKSHVTNKKNPYIIDYLSCKTVLDLKRD